MNITIKSFIGIFNFFFFLHVSLIFINVFIITYKFNGGKLERHVLSSLQEYFIILGTVFDLTLLYKESSTVV